MGSSPQNPFENSSEEIMVNLIPKKQLAHHSTLTKTQGIIHKDLPYAYLMAIAERRSLPTW